MAKARIAADEVGTAPEDMDNRHPLIWPFPVIDSGFKNYVILEGALDKDECEALIEIHTLGLTWNRDRTVDTIPPGLHRYEAALVSTRHDWIYERCTELCLDVNAEHYGYSLHGMVEEMRTLRYAEGDQGAMHCDHTEIDLSKLAWTTCLKPADKGGQFMLATWGAIPLNQGDMLFFPAMMGHGVLPVEKGTRYQMVGWASGSRYV